MRAFVLAALAATACGGSGKRVEAIAIPDTTVAAPSLAGDEIDFWSGDGDDAFHLHGTYVAPAAATPACVLFAHQLQSSRVEWAPVIDGLRGRAHLLAVDLRGHGASTETRGGTLTWREFTEATWTGAELDLARALDELRARGAGPRCVVVGASIGSSATLRMAAAHPDRIAGVVLLSPGLNYWGLGTPDAARAVRAPVFLVHSQENGALDAATALSNILREQGTAVEVIADPGEGHGMSIVNGDDALRERLVAFIAGRLDG